MARCTSSRTLLNGTQVVLGDGTVWTKPDV